MARVILAVLALVAAPSLALKLVGEADFKIQTAAYERAEVEDETFLADQWHSLEADLAKFESVVHPESHDRVRKPEMAGLQLGVAPVMVHKAGEKNTTSGKNATIKHEAASKNATKQSHAATMASAALSMKKGPVDKIQLTMMEGMLEGLYEDQKGRIVKINKQEEKSKKRYDEQEKAFKAKIERIEKEHKEGRLDDEFFHNETRDNTKQFDYWKRCRERNHQQFHNSLKITHATMQKEKAMIKAYKEALAGPTPTKNEDGGKQLAKIAKDVGMPEIVFVQQAHAVIRFCRSSIADVRDALTELSTPVSVRQ